MLVMASRTPKDLRPGPKVKCKSCGFVIQSKHRYYWDRCECGALSVYGGKSFPELLGDRALALEEDGTPFFQQCTDTWCTTWIRTSEHGLCPHHLDELLEKLATKRKKA